MKLGSELLRGCLRATTHEPDPDNAGGGRKKWTQTLHTD